MPLADQPAEDNDTLPREDEYDENYDDVDDYDAEYDEDNYDENGDPIDQTDDDEDEISEHKKATSPASREADSTKKENDDADDYDDKEYDEVVETDKDIDKAETTMKPTDKETQIMKEYDHVSEATAINNEVLKIDQDAIATTTTTALDRIDNLNETDWTLASSTTTEAIRIEKEEKTNVETIKATQTEETDDNYDDEYEEEYEENEEELVTVTSVASKEGDDDDSVNMLTTTEEIIISTTSPQTTNIQTTPFQTTTDPTPPIQVTTERGELDITTQLIEISSTELSPVNEDGQGENIIDRADEENGNYDDEYDEDYEENPNRRTGEVDKIQGSIPDSAETTTTIFEDEYDYEDSRIKEKEGPSNSEIKCGEGFVLDSYGNCTGEYQLLDLNAS